MLSTIWVNNHRHFGCDRIDSWSACRDRIKRLITSSRGITINCNLKRLIRKNINSNFYMKQSQLQRFHNSPDHWTFLVKWRVDRSGKINQGFGWSFCLFHIKIMFSCKPCNSPIICSNSPDRLSCEQNKLAQRLHLHNRECLKSSSQGVKSQF